MARLASETMALHQRDPTPKRNDKIRKFLWKKVRRSESADQNWLDFVNLQCELRKLLSIQMRSFSIYVRDWSCFECTTRWIGCASKWSRFPISNGQLQGFWNDCSLSLSCTPPPTLTHGVKSIIYDGGMLWLLQITFVPAGDELRGGERRMEAEAGSEAWREKR